MKVKTYECNDCGEEVHCSNGELCLDCKNKRQEGKSKFKECRRPRCDKLANKEVNRGWCWVCHAGKEMTKNREKQTRGENIY